MDKLLKILERAIITVLVVLMGIILLLSVIELTWVLARDILTPPFLLLDVDELLELFGLFLLVLIGIELLQTIKAYLSQKMVHVEVVVDVALIAIARKVIILNVEEYEPLQVIGIALIITALAVAHYLVKARVRSAAERRATTKDVTSETR